MGGSLTFCTGCGYLVCMQQTDQQFQTMQMLYLIVVKVIKVETHVNKYFCSFLYRCSLFDVPFSNISLICCEKMDHVVRIILNNQFEQSCQLQCSLLYVAAILNI